MDDQPQPGEGPHPQAPARLSKIPITADPGSPGGTTTEHWRGHTPPARGPGRTPSGRRRRRQPGLEGQAGLGDAEACQFHQLVDGEGAATHQRTDQGISGRPPLPLWGDGVQPAACTLYPASRSQPGCGAPRVQVEINDFFLIPARAGLKMILKKGVQFWPKMAFFEGLGEFPDTEVCQFANLPFANSANLPIRGSLKTVG